MAVPPIIALVIKKNVFQKTIYTLTTTFAVESDTFVDVGALHKEDYAKVIFELINDGANGVDLEFFGTSLDDNSVGPPPPNFNSVSESIPPDFATGVYRLLDNGALSIATTLKDARKITDNITWVLIRAKRTTAGQDTSLDIHTRGE